MKIEGGKERLLPYTVLYIGNFIGITLTDICKIEERTQEVLMCLHFLPININKINLTH